MANKKIRFGDTVRIKDEKFNQPLYVEARIFEQRRDIFTKSNKRDKLGDFIEYTEEEARAVIDRLSKQIQAKISQSEHIEYTYSKIEIDDKDEYIFDEGKTFAEAVGVEAKEYAESEDEALRVDVEGYADSVASQAEDNAKSYADDKSAEALSEALAQSVAQDAYDTKMAQIADDLSEKAGIEYVDGQLQVIDGAIADLNAEIETKADGSTVYTISEVDNMINNTVSLTQYTTDINGIISDLSSQSTQIGQNTEAIGLKADQTTVNALAGTVDDQSAELLTMADEISAKVTADYVQTAIDDVEIGGRNYQPKITSTSQGAGGMGRIIDDYTLEIDLPSSSPSQPYVFIPRLTSDFQTEDTYTVSFYATLLSSDNDENERIRYGLRSNGSRADQSTTFEVGERKKVEYSHLNSDGDSNFRMIFFSNGDNNMTFLIERIKVEKGNKATDWTPAPEDIDAEISSLSAELSVQAGIIEGKAESTVVDAQGVRITTAEQTIDAIEGKISLVVSEDDKINAEAIASELSVTPSAIDLISPKINLSADQINFDGHVFGHGASFSGDLSSKRVEIGGDNPNIDWGQWTSTGLEIKNPIRVSEGNYYWDGVFEIGVGNSIVDFGFRDNSTGANGQFSFWGHSTFYSGLST